MMLSECIRLLPENKEWRKKVKKRDKHTCTVCGSKEHVEAHHIIPFHMLLGQLLDECGMSELKINGWDEGDLDYIVDKAKENSALWDLENGITLCFECHRSGDE